MPFDEPERQPLGAVLAGGTVGLLRHVVLKRVDQLVADHVVRVGEWTCEWEDDATAQSFGDAARAFPDLATNDVGLFELDVRAVEDQRLATAQLVLKQALEPRMPALGKARGDIHARFLAWIEVDIEVLGLQDLEIEGSILNLVVAEVLRRRGRTETCDGTKRKSCRRSAECVCSNHPTPPVRVSKRRTTAGVRCACRFRR
jgi:hypothetical protein